jgi:hypothetical protein
MREFLATIQRESLPGIWSKGVKLARANAVTLKEALPGEHVFRVRTPGRPVAPLCVLYLQEGEWTCDCGSDQDPC